MRGINFTKFDSKDKINPMVFLIYSSWNLWDTFPFLNWMIDWYFYLNIKYLQLWWLYMYHQAFVVVMTFCIYILQVGDFANCLIEARNELQHKYVLNYFEEAKVMFDNSFCFLFSKTCFWEYKEKTIFLYFWNQKHVWLVEIKNDDFLRKK